MVSDPHLVQQIVEIIAQEVLTAMEENRWQKSNTAGSCKRECAEGICVHTVFDEVGNVVSAGAERISFQLGNIPDDLSVASMIDHTLLKPDATVDQVKQLCDEAKKYQFASVCVNPANVKLCWELLHQTPVKVCSVIGFPLGANVPDVKAMETQLAIQHGASEIDMVINIGALKSGDLDLVARDIHSVVVAAHKGGAILKVIIETALLTQDEKVMACLLAKEAGADFVKTSTGFSGGGATVEDISLMRRVVGLQMGVKASGGVRTSEDAEKMVKAGANRLGASASVKIVQGASNAPVSQTEKAASAQGY
jgi:deoxyribose-phosphate aldolase